MANYAEPNPIGPTKFARLTALQRHKLLARLADRYGEAGDTAGFLARYAALTAEGGIDRFDAPPWLTPLEAMAQIRAFHARLAHLPLDQDPGRPEADHSAAFSEQQSPSQTRTSNAQPQIPDLPLAWRPRFAVEVIATQIRNPFNFGAILRLIDNFGLAGLTHDSTWLELSHPRLRSAARGTENWIPIRCEPDLPSHLEGLRAQGLHLYALDEDPAALSILEWKPLFPCALVVGNETFGIPEAVRARCSQAVRIPMLGYKNSMNLSHALAIAAFHIGSTSRSLGEPGF